MASLTDPFVHLPAHQRALETVLAILPPGEVVLEGSGARGTADKWSDIDLRLTVHMDRHPAAVEAVVQGLRELPGVLAVFPADHLNLPLLAIAVMDTGDLPVKVDIWTDTDPPICAQASIGPADAGWDARGLLERAKGWSFYAYTKIRRGELLEAADALYTLQTRALLAMWQLEAGLPREGLRHAEQRLSPEQCALLGQEIVPEPSPAAAIQTLHRLLGAVENAWAALGHEADPGLTRLSAFYQADPVS